MKTITSNPLSLLLLAGGLAYGNMSAQTSSTLEEPKTDMRREGSHGNRSPSNNDEDRARQALQRAEEKSNSIQSKFQLQNNKDAEPLLNTLKTQLAEAREAMANGNFQAVISICSQTEDQVALLYNLGSRTFTDRRRGSSHSNGMDDSGRDKEQQKARAAWDLQKAVEQFELTVQLMQEDKSTNALALIEKCRNLLADAKEANSQERFEQVRPLLEKIETLRLEISQFKNRSGRFEDHNVPGTNPDTYNGLQPNHKSNYSDAIEIYNRVHDRVLRIVDQKQGKDDEKSLALFARIVEMLEKCRESLNNGQTEAAKAMALKAETMLSEWHQEQGRNKGSAGKNNLGSNSSLGNASKDQTTSALDRLKVKLDRATEIVAMSKNEKANNILRKGLEHFDRAEHSQSEGQAARAQVEMDIALKLVAKAVDIARAGQKR
jgi:hypothetical protein